MTIRCGASVRSTPTRAASASNAPTRAARNAGVSRKFRNPAPAISTGALISASAGSALSAPWISVASARGFVRRCFASAIAALL